MSAPPYMPVFIADYTSDVQALTCEQDGAYWRLLRAMWRAGGKLPNVSRKLALIVGLSEERWAEIGSDVLELFQHQGGQLVHKRLSAEYQKASSKSLAKSESGRRGGLAKANKNKAETPSEDVAKPKHIKPKPIESSPTPPQEGATVDEVKVAFDLWNETAKLCDLTVARDFTEARRKVIAARLKTGGLGGWREVMDVVQHSRFLRGMVRPRDREKPFECTLDWISKAANYQKVRDGNYGRDAYPPRQGQAPALASEADIWRKRVRESLHGGYWDTYEWGKHPGHPSCEAPPEILREFGFDPPALKVVGGAS